MLDRNGKNIKIGDDVLRLASKNTTSCWGVVVGLAGDDMVYVRVDFPQSLSGNQKWTPAETITIPMVYSVDRAKELVQGIAP